MGAQSRHSCGYKKKILLLSSCKICKERKIISILALAKDDQFSSEEMLIFLIVKFLVISFIVIIYNY